MRKIIVKYNVLEFIIYKDIHYMNIIVLDIFYEINKKCMLLCYQLKFYNLFRNLKK